jgi:ubiquinone/menaquinone biosynthesis C-methylase UbiE
VALAKDGEIRPGKVLDAGCGTGENALMLARSGCTVTGIDIVESAIAIARSKAEKRKTEACFIVGNALDMDQYFREATFDTVIDSGLFHAMSDEERPLYARQICWPLKPGGGYFLLCYSDREPGDWGPRRISRREIEETFGGLFHIRYIKESFFLTRAGTGRSHAYLLSAAKA